MGADYYAGRVSVITGAGAGIGRALALQLADRGARLALWDVNAGSLSKTAARCRRVGAQVRADVVDVADRTSVLEHAADVREQFGRVDLAFCVAGVIHTGSLADSDLDDFDHVMNVNLWGTVNTVKALLPMIVASGEGHIVTVSSAFGLVAAPRYSAYATSKFAVRGFTEALRQELAIDGPVQVSCAFPGGVRTQIIRTGRFAAGEDAAATADLFDRRIARTTPEKAASTILRGVQRGRAQILVGADAHLVWLLLRVVGASYQRILPRILRGRDAPDQSRQAERQVDRQMRSRWRSWPNGGS